MSMPPVGFEPTISAGERPQTYAYRTTTGTGHQTSLNNKIFYVNPSAKCIVVIHFSLFSKSKANLLQAWTGPEGSRRLRLPRFKTVDTQSYAPAAFTSRKYSWYSFLLEAGSTPGP